MSASISWFCKSGIGTTFYIVREQANRPVRVFPGETTDELFKNLSAEPYNKSCLIVLKFKQKESFPYHKNLKRFKGEGIVTCDRKKKGIKDFPSFDLYDNGNVHWKCTIVNVLHLVWYLKYKRILFVGVDLYDSRYFWLKNKVRACVKKKRKNCDSKHSITPLTIAAVRTFQKHYPAVEMFVYNPKSILRKCMPIWEE